MLRQELLLLLLVTFHSNCKGCKNFQMALFLKAAQSTSSNVVISPVGQENLLSMIMEGAVNETKAEIETALKDRSAITRSADVKIESRIFLEKAQQIKENYREELRKKYSADVEGVAIEKVEEMEESVKKFLKNDTAGMVQLLVKKSIAPTLVMIIGQTIEFKALWNWEFDGSKNECFYKNGKDCVMQEMMTLDNRRFKYGYFEELDADIVDIPYKDAGYSMMIVLPKQRNGVDQLVAKLHNYSINDFSSKLSSSSVNLKIPKFTAETDTTYVETLMSLNIKRIFGTKSQLDNMMDAGGPVYAAQLLYRSKIVVNELGSDPAAASPGSKTSNVAGAGRKILFVADHPFLYFVKDDHDNVFFAGKYVGP